MSEIPHFDARAPAGAAPPYADLLAAAEAVPGAAVPAAQETTDDLVGIEGAEAAAVAPETQSVPAAAALPVAATMPVAAPVLGGGLAAAPAVAQPRSTRPRPDDGQRVGTWRSEERQYVTEVILRFGEGRLPNVPDNTSLRVLLSNVLNCSPMRITKKFSGRNALPRGRYRRTVEPEAAVVERLRTLERAFHRRVRDDGTVLTITLCGTYDLPTVKAIADAAAAAASAARVAAGGGGRTTVADREASALALADGVASGLEGPACVLRRTVFRRPLHRRNDLRCGSGRASTATGARGRAREDFDRHCWTAGLDAGPAHHAGPGRGWRTCRGSRTCSDRAHGRAAGSRHERVCLLSGRLCVFEH